eukprot:8865572-Pyramimonas_sp.AAC.1
MKVRVDMVESVMQEREEEINKELAQIENVLRRHRTDGGKTSKKMPAEKIRRACENNNFSEMHRLRVEYPNGRQPKK